MSRLEGAFEEEKEENYGRSVLVRNGGKNEHIYVRGIIWESPHEIGTTCTAKFTIRSDRSGSFRTRLWVFVLGRVGRGPRHLR